MLIYKFGGKVLTNQKDVIKQIEEGLKKEDNLIIVLSAIGRYPSAYATDTFLKMGEVLSTSELKRLLACGEMISSLYYTNLLKKRGIDAYQPSLMEMGLEIKKDGLTISHSILNIVKSHQVTVIPGFIALENGDITTLPRGGSNITACFLAYYFNADLFLFSDVIGIYEADPKIKKSKLKKKINCNELENITANNPTFFPKMALDYIKKGSFLVFYGSLKNENRTIITNY